MCLEISENLVHIYRAGIRHRYFLEKSPQYLSHAVHGLRIVESSGFLKLGEQVGGALDGTGDKLWEETHKSEELDDIAGGLQFLAVNINAVTQCLEGVKTDADGKDDVKQQSVSMSKWEEFAERGNEEVVVFENA